MAQETTRPEIDSDYARTLIRQKARQLSRRADFSRSDEDDIAQELVLHLLSQADRFDSTRASLKTFITHVVNSSVAMILRERWRQKRVPKNGAEIQTLEMMVDMPDEPPVPLWSTISRADIERRTGATSKSEAELQEEAEALEHAIQSLSLEDRDLCERLKVGSRTRVARDLQISRRTLGTWIARISSMRRTSSVRRWSVSLPICSCVNLATKPSRCVASTPARPPRQKGGLHERHDAPSF